MAENSWLDCKFERGQIQISRRGEIGKSSTAMLLGDARQDVNEIAVSVLEPVQSTFERTIGPTFLAIFLHPLALAPRRTPLFLANYGRW